MQVDQRAWSAAEGWSAPSMAGEPDLVIVFGGGSALEHPRCLPALAEAYPRATIFGCSTAGEIQGTHVTDDSVIATTVRFAGTRLRSVDVPIADASDSRAAGTALADALDAPDLVHVLVLSDGLRVNGSELVRGLTGALPPSVAITGGLAGDGARFHRTLVVSGGRAREGRVAALGLYGSRIRIGFGSLGGWDAFGAQREVTLSEGNVLFELDGQPALALYRKYLGDDAAGLPATGLLFPLSVTTASGVEVVRTILAVDEERQALVFAGEVPQGSTARLMKANFDRLVDGASGAARSSTDALGAADAELAILISCVGRKLVLKQRVEDEVEAVREVVGPGAALAGFYSYGEICPSAPNASCELHNQTMTVTTLREV